MKHGSLTATSILKNVFKKYVNNYLNTFQIKYLKYYPDTVYSTYQKYLNFI